ncbi:MAG: hypothetical protein UU81_C0037G0002 [Microgenomates group bacterium GW2011_GWC1_41_8]|uniref:SEA domain-containing protein n=3 Tax=Candidatus Roizmaniibacteriota TaxID=1752723 RepID=A0A0G0XDD2_9BACT|nr:MAG: hypothetical protein UU14_C0019G0012 [Candidatus Roizmanbacteria bacterium GW2011_GWB1_40_7]KKR94084.1 MAG: hypothetical protein UU41_C0013G0006 [Candidatus Roizmanbacteria bacterium GW2011_GWA1_41_13]KKS22407.1 MAG: hypothetical protein UU78_C0017G0011 [Candidatus Roizmanbacteria bacterium GW2011_GWC2_41_7]KKS23214.1 MAG: hypothetical protein UU81_C0037G0002 [Microgenomates group bacterium GW2011_GWC1_41_8]OGK50747.1 MAG: hypothetical protein A3A55_03815 [Candidatus Roizmanbacteria bac
MKKSGIAIGIIAALIVLFFYNAFQPKSENTEEVHYHAGFIVYNNNEKVDFSDLKFMHIEPCSEKEEEHEEDEQEEKAHLHDGIGNVVHVHRNNAYWRDLFTNIGYELEEPVTGYIDGALVENILDKKIQPYQSVVIFTGKNMNVEEKLNDSTTREQIETAEQKTESC